MSCSYLKCWFTLFYSGIKITAERLQNKSFGIKNVFWALNVFLFHQQIPVVVELQISLVVTKIIGLPFPVGVGVGVIIKIETLFFESVSKNGGFIVGIQFMQNHTIGF